MQNTSTTDCLFILLSIVGDPLHRKRKVYCTFIDLQKAFDLLYRNTIWFILFKVGASLKFVKAVKAINNAVKICVRSCGKVSDFLTSLLG